MEKRIVYILGIIMFATTVAGCLPIRPGEGRYCGYWGMKRFSDACKDGLTCFNDGKCRHQAVQGTRAAVPTNVRGICGVVTAARAAAGETRESAFGEVRLERSAEARTTVGGTSTVVTVRPKNGHSSAAA